MKSIYVSDRDNPHHFDEVSKNCLSKYISTRCRYAQFYRLRGYMGGHRTVKAGHRIASGIVRQKIKEEIRREVIDSVL